jgi:hypothetical protein
MSTPPPETASVLASLLASPSPRALIRAEVNLERFPFFSPADTPKDSRLVYTVTREQMFNGVKMEMEWKVLAHPHYGFPSRFDRDVYRALQQILWEDGIPEDGVILLPSFARLLRIMMIDPAQYTTRCSGWYYERIVESFKRMKTTVVESRNALYLKGRRQWVTDTFSLIDRYVQKGDVMEDQTIALEHRIYLSSWYLENIRARYIKPLDVGYYFLLRRSVSRALYAYLDLCFYRISEGEIFEIEYERLCEQLMLVPQKKRSLMLASLGPAHEELLGSGYLSMAECVPLAMGHGHKLRYAPGPRFWQARAAASPGFLLDEVEPEPNQMGLAPSEETVRQQAARLVIEFHTVVRKVSGYRPNSRELNYATELVQQHGQDAWVIVRHAIEQAQRTRFALGSFVGIRRYVPEAIHALSRERAL